ncbi:unnamed protein product, partial [Urochloa humidicola]
FRVPHVDYIHDARNDQRGAVLDHTSWRVAIPKLQFGSTQGHTVVDINYTGGSEAMIRQWSKEKLKCVFLCTFQLKARRCSLSL